MLYTQNQPSKYSTFQYLRTKMLLWILIFLLPILIILCVSMNSIFSAYSKQMTINYSQSLQQFTSDIDSDLTAAKRILYSENVSPDFLHLELGSGLPSLESMQDFGTRLTSILTIQERLEAFFLYNQEEIFFVQNYNTSYVENRRMADTLTHYILEEQDQPFCPSGEYQAIKSGDNYYLYLGFDIDEGIWGCWFSVSHLLESIYHADMQGVVDIFLTLPDGTVLSSSYDFMNSSELMEAFSPYSVTSQALSAAPFLLTVLWDKDIIYQTLYQTQRLILYVIVLAFLLLIIYLFFLRRSLFIPLRRLTENIDRLGMADLGQVQRSQNESVEFQRIYHALLSMTREILDLRIHVYEKELLQQKTQLELYQLQIRPHFFLNALNNIQCLTRSERLPEADKMIAMLARHCRYVLYNSQFVLLDEELNFVENYIQLQSVQHNRQYHFEVTCKEELLDYEIPILIIQILVENAIKHTGGENSLLKIRVQVTEESIKDVTCLQISVIDNGPGLSPEVLLKLQHADSLHQPGESHGIGISNIRRRLNLIYGDVAFLDFQNEPEGGTRVTLHFPTSHDRR